MTSSASYGATPTRAMPRASRTSSITGTCGASVSGISSSSGPAGVSSATRWALYEGIRSTRHCGRQSASIQATRSSGWWSWTSRAMKSSRPRTALTGVPSGALTESGTPKYARK